MEGKPPFGQERACLTENLVPQPQDDGTCRGSNTKLYIGGEILVPRYRKLQLLFLQAIVDVAVIAMFSRTFQRKNHLSISLCCWDMAWKLGWNLLKVVPFLLQKLGRIFCPTSITKIVNISGSTQPFFTKQGPLDSQLDNISFNHISKVFSNTFRNSPESLLLGAQCAHELGSIAIIPDCTRLVQCIRVVPPEVLNHWSHIKKLRTSHQQCLLVLFVIALFSGPLFFLGEGGKRAGYTQFAHASKEKSLGTRLV